MPDGPAGSPAVVDQDAEETGRPMARLLFEPMSRTPSVVVPTRLARRRSA
ncbi:hypothetical protein [Streptomyces sp. A012304]|nr:hypothetical protein [Streptomyces sp. A012304]